MEKFFSISASKLGLALVFLVTLSVAGVAQTTPSAAVIDSNNQVKAVLDAKGGRLNAETEASLKTIISRATDFKAMSEAAFKAFPANTTVAQKAEFKAAFEELLLLSSVKKMGRYRADRFEYGAQTITGNTALVKTVAVYTKSDGREDRVRLDYTLSNATGSWMIVNYAMDDVDTIRNYQRQFRVLINRQGVEGAINQIKKRVDEYRVQD